MIRKILLIALLGITVFSLLGCQTIQGLGKDIEWTASKISGDAPPD